MAGSSNVISAHTVASPAGWLRWLSTGWLIAATCDICYATGFSYLYRGTPPSRILQSVASGLLGADAYQGGATTAALGLGLHYINALIITCIFFAVASQAPALVRKPLVVGVLYGIVVYAVMNYVVVPMSRIGPRPTPPTPTWVSGLLVHMFLIGVPIAWAANRAFARQR
jgi:uncharacterized membrane protein YagU involved in acid resistance